MSTAEGTPEQHSPRLRPFPRTDETEPPFEPTSWGGAFAFMVFCAAVLWAVQLANAVDSHGLDRFGLRPRQVDGLWGILTTNLLHNSAWQLLSSTGPFVLIGWVLLLSGLRNWMIVTGIVLVLGGALTWLIAPNGLILGCSGLIFGWMGYLLARAYFSRRILWILAAIAVAFFFSGLFAGLLPSINSRSSWQAHVCSFAAGVVAGWVLHPRRPRARKTSAAAKTSGDREGGLPGSLS